MIQARRGWRQPRMPPIMLSRSIRTCRKLTLHLVIIVITGRAISPQGWRNSSKLKRAFRITLISSMRSPLSNDDLGIGTAITALRRNIELDPRDLNAYHTLAGTYYSLRRFPEALATLDRI